MSLAAVNQEMISQTKLVNSNYKWRQMEIKNEEKVSYALHIRDHVK